MMSMEQLASLIVSLPIDDQLKMLNMLEGSVSEHLDHLAEEELRNDLAVVEQRLSDLDAGRVTGRPFDIAMQSLFPKRS